jgi:hypothetical protein
LALIEPPVDLVVLQHRDRLKLVQHLLFIVDPLSSTRDQPIIRASNDATSRKHLTVSTAVAPASTRRQLLFTQLVRPAPFQNTPLLGYDSPGSNVGEPRCSASDSVRDRYERRVAPDIR